MRSRSSDKLGKLAKAFNSCSPVNPCQSCYLSNPLTGPKSYGAFDGFWSDISRSRKLEILAEEAISKWQLAISQTSYRGFTRKTADLRKASDIETRHCRV